MDLEIFDETKEASKEWLNMIAQLLNYAGDYIDLPGTTEMSVTLVNNDRIHAINKEYRGVNKATDVIGWAIEEDDGEEEPIIFSDDLDIDIPKNIGDIFVSLEKVKEQAEYLGHSEKRELGFLVVHGFLHLN